MTRLKKSPLETFSHDNKAVKIYDVSNIDELKFDSPTVSKNMNEKRRIKCSYSLSNELRLRIKMLTNRINHESLLEGNGCKKVYESDLIEQGMKIVLKKYSRKLKKT